MNIDQIDSSVMQNSEKIVFSLRKLFLSNGYVLYHMKKFEEYDLYSRNKDFLVSDNVITFTDNGKLMALKPDVTLSIIKNCTDDIEKTEKLFYNENVYRVSDDSGSFKEIMQVGAECIGRITENELCECVGMALSGLRMFSDDHIIAISDLDIIYEILNELSLGAEKEKAICKALAERNTHSLDLLLSDCADRSCADKLKMLASVNGSIGEVIKKLEPLFRASAAFGKFEKIVKKLGETEHSDRLTIDFSVSCDMNYYNGIVFRGYIKGNPDYVLSGGQYDRLMSKMGKKSKAVGFAVYTERLDKSDPGKAKDSYINIALPKGRLGESVYGMFADAGYECPSLLEPNRKLIFENSEKKVRYFWVKPSDVAIYVERGAADVGVAGKDILLEYEPDVYELLDLKKGKCKMAVAAKKGFTERADGTLRVATKFENIAKTYYQSLGRDIDVISLNGSIEIAPILGLSDVIVDIVETGTTLRENGLEVLSDIMPISARLIANKSSSKFKGKEIDKLIAALSSVTEENQ